MSATINLSEKNEKYFKEKLKPGVYASYKRGEAFFKGEILAVNFEDMKFVINNDKENRPEFNKTLPINDNLRVMMPGQKHDFREVNNVKMLTNAYNIPYDAYKSNIMDMCSGSSCMSSVLIAEKRYKNEDGSEEYKTYPVRLKIVNDEIGGGKRLKQVLGYTRKEFEENYTGENIGMSFTVEMKKDLIEKGTIGVHEVAFKSDGLVKPKFIGFDSELNIVVPISVEKIESDLKNGFTPEQISSLLKGGTAYTKTGKEVKIDTVTYLTKGNIVKATGKKLQEIETTSEQLKNKKPKIASTKSDLDTTKSKKKRMKVS